MKYTLNLNQDCTIFLKIPYFRNSEREKIGFYHRLDFNCWCFDDFKCVLTWELY